VIGAELIKSIFVDSSGSYFSVGRAIKIWTPVTAPFDRLSLYLI